MRIAPARIASAGKSTLMRRTPQDAVQEARAIQLDPNNLATAYEIWECDVDGADHHMIDLNSKRS